MHPVILVLAASGGLGASTFAAALAARVSSGGRAVLIDGDLHGGGIDSTAAIEHEPGLRWGDLGAVEGPVEGSRLIAALPAAGDVAVLSAGGDLRPSPSVIIEVISALAEQAVVVIDGARGALHPWVEVADHLLLLVGTRPRRLRDGERLVRDLGRARGEALIVTRGSRRARAVGESVAAHLEIPWVDHVRDDPAVVRDEARGRYPRPRGSLGEVVEATVDAFGLDLRARREDLTGRRAS
ncbi:hypothetical protein [Janibacter sp. GXQ6167]|uniref:hypothetical protein n=1 Tax=Janibacter sp. GXQ6167 TaxID=3240791 RepID=UPI0035238739